MIQITGNFAITYAALKGLSLNQVAGSWGPARSEVGHLEADSLEGPAREAIWVEAGERDFARFLTDEALDNLVTIGDAEILPLWYAPEGTTQIEIVYLTNQDYAVRDRPRGIIEQWEIVRGRDQLLEHIIGLLRRATRHPVS